MSRKRKSWFDAIIFLASLTVMVSVMSLSMRTGRGMATWPVWIWGGAAAVLFTISLIIHEGKDVLALPQALWMAIQDRRKMNGLHKR